MMNVLESMDDEDEVLLALAEEIGRLVDYVGGKSFAHVLISPLEKLAAVEETVVREKASFFRDMVDLFRFLLSSRHSTLQILQVSYSGVELNEHIDQAVASLSSVCELLSQDQVERFYLPCLKRLTSADWFTSKTSACGLFTAAYGKCSSTVNDELRR